MKIAITFKKDENQLAFILHTLKIRGYEVGDSSDKWTYWIYNLKNIQFFGDCIQILNKKFETTKIYLSNIEYFEVDEEKK